MKTSYFDMKRRKPLSWRTSWNRVMFSILSLELARLRSQVRELDEGFKNLVGVPRRPERVKRPHYWYSAENRAHLVARIAAVELKMKKYQT